MHNRMDRYNYSLFEKNSHQINNKPKENNSSTGKARLAAFNYDESFKNFKYSTLHNAKKEQAQALDKECKRVAVLYPFLTKSQIRSKAKEVLSNASKTTPCKWQLDATPKGKAAFKFVDKPRICLNKPSRKHQEYSDTMSEEESDFAQKSNILCKSKLMCQKDDDIDDNVDDGNDGNDDSDNDPDYHPSSSHKSTPKPKQNKSSHNKKPQTKKAHKTSGFMDLGENAFSDGEESTPGDRQSSSKIKPTKMKFRSFKAKVQTRPTVRTSNTTYEIQHQCKGDLPDKAKEAPCHQTADVHSSDYIFDKLLIDDSTQQSHVSESPDSTTATISLRKACEVMNSVSNPVVRPPVTVVSCTPNRKKHSINANTVNKTPHSQSDEEIFANSKRQRPKPFPKFSVENGYEVITLSSDSEDEVSSTDRPLPRPVRYLPVNPDQVKLEMDASQLPNAHSSVNEQPKKSPLVNVPVMTNVQPSIGDSGNKTGHERLQLPIPRGILKHTPQRICHVLQSNGQTSRTVQTPKLVKYQTPPKKMKDASTQMTPRSDVRIKVRPQMTDKASEVNMDDEKYVECSSLDSPCFIKKRFLDTRGFSSVQNQLDDAMRRIEKTITGRARQFQRMQVVTPKLCSAQTQTDPPAVREARNSASFYFLPGQSVHHPTLNSETPHKRYVSWKEDRIIQLAEDNAAKPHEKEEKQLALASKRDSDHDRFLYSVKMELELLGEKLKFENGISGSDALAGLEISNLDVSSPESIAFVQEIPSGGLTQNSILDAAAENDMTNDWFNMFYSPIRPSDNLNFGADKITAEASLNFKNAIDKNSNLNAVKNMDLNDKIVKQTAVLPSNNTAGSTLLSPLKSSTTSESSVSNTNGNILSLEIPKLALPLSSSQESTETTYSPISSEEIVFQEENWETESEASSLPNSPLDLGMPKDKVASGGLTSTPALAPNGSTNLEPTLLETLLAKMRSFGTGSIISEKPEKSPFTPRRLPTWSSFTQQRSEPPQKKLKAARPRILLQDSVMLPSKQLLPSPIRKSPRTPQNEAKKAYGDNSCADDTTPKKGDLLCDLFDVATPRSAGGTLNRYIGYSRQFQPHSVFDEDCSDAFD